MCRHFAALFQVPRLHVGGTYSGVIPLPRLRKLGYEFVIVIQGGQ